MKNFMEISGIIAWTTSIGWLVSALIVPDKAIDYVQAMVNHMYSLRRKIKHIK